MLIRLVGWIINVAVVLVLLYFLGIFALYALNFFGFFTVQWMAANFALFLMKVYIFTRCTPSLGVHLHLQTKNFTFNSK